MFSQSISLIPLEFRFGTPKSEFSDVENPQIYIFTSKFQFFFYQNLDFVLGSTLHTALQELNKEIEIANSPDKIDVARRRVVEIDRLGGRSDEQNRDQNDRRFDSNGDEEDAGRKSSGSSHGMGSIERALKIGERNHSSSDVCRDMRRQDFANDKVDRNQNQEFAEDRENADPNKNVTAGGNFQGVSKMDRYEVSQVEEKFGEQNFRVLTLALGADAVAKSILQGMSNSFWDV